ncbi:hypothetical protein [Pseudomonas sp. Irchel 3A5]|uniref:hypothetical protein n=1 Tax=Pseudomonas sp. Irchel 3A5 TaxID=2008911 RepID=UPI000BA403B7|nr:hypothetical protein [Pseudomonas sp. Irchel 3A5]
MTRDNQELRDALVSAAFLLKWSSADLHKKAQDLADAGNQTEADAIREIVNNYQACESNLLSFADEVKAGRINRESVEEPR